MSRTKSRTDRRAFAFALAWAIVLVGFVLVTFQLPEDTAPTSQISHSRT